MAKKCKCDNCTCKNYVDKSNAISVVVYDLGGAPIDPQAVRRLEQAAEEVALSYRLIVNVTRN